jgi:hypothetical protein
MIIPVAIVVVPVLLVSRLPPISSPYLYLVIPAMSCLAVVNASQALFSYDALGRLDTLYAALGIRRRHVVAGRYATCLLALLALTIAGVFLAAVAALGFGAAFDWRIAAAIAVGSVALIGILLAVQLPAYFATGPGPVRTWAAVPPAIVVTALLIGCAIPDVRTALLSWLDDANVAGLALATVAIVGALGAASTALSTRLYARRDL